jgi:hypothetical protein
MTPGRCYTAAYGCFRGSYRCGEAASGLARQPERCEQCKPCYSSTSPHKSDTDTGTDTDSHLESTNNCNTDDNDDHNHDDDANSINGFMMI